MNKGLSLHIGVRVNDPVLYQGGSHPRLEGCAIDAFTMQRIAAANRFQSTTVLIDERATFDAVERHVRRAIGELCEGDTFLWSFSGHGVQAPSVDPLDGYDEGMALYDYDMLDDHINVLLRGFEQGVRIILVADCCYSSSIQQVAPKKKRVIADPAAGSYMNDPDCGYKNKLIPWDVAEKRHIRLADHYARLKQRFESEGGQLRDTIAADLVLLAACGEVQLAADTPSGGVFTQCLLSVLTGTGMRSGLPYRGSYKGLKDAIHYLAPEGQMPDISVHGPNELNDCYPFFLGPPFSL